VAEPDRAPAVEFLIDPGAPGDRGEIVESLVAVLLSAPERRRERAQQPDDPAGGAPK